MKPGEAPCTPTQVGAIRREMNRLGITDRAERLAVCAALAGVEDLGSTADLTMGQAGRVYRALVGISDRAELATPKSPTPLPISEAAGLDHEDQADEADEDQAGEQPAAPTPIQAIQRLVDALAQDTPETPRD